MQDITVKIIRLVDSVKLPRYEHDDDSGLDLFATKEQEISPGETALVGVL